MSTPDHPDWNTPLAIAAYLAGGSPTTPPGGVPLITKSSGLFTMSASQNVAAGTTFTVPGSPLALTQIGYEAFIQVSANAASVYPIGRLILTWSDSASGLTTWVDTFGIHGGNAAFEQYYMTGPTKGNQLTVTFTCDDAAHALQFQMTLLQNSRVYVRDDLRQLTNQPVPSATLGGYDQSAGVLLNAAGTVAAAGTLNNLIAQYAGKIVVTTAGPLAYNASILAQDNKVSPGLPFVIWASGVTAAGGGQLNFEATLPRAPCFLVITNNGTVSGAFTGTVTAAEYPA